MNRKEIIERVRSNVNDFKGTVFKDDVISNYINESIDRIKQVIIEMSGMKYLEYDDEVSPLLPQSYHHLLSIYSTSRCFSQDERHYQAINTMNEFEVKLDELKDKVDNGEIIVVDENGEEVYSNLKTEYVFDNYFDKKNYNKDYDEYVR